MSASNAQSQIELHRALAPRYAYRYSLPFSKLFQEDWHRQMLQHLPARARRVLDLGCGTGFFLAELEAQRPGAVGLDISHDMLRVSEQYVPGARVVTADAERLPFAERSFDAVFCKGSLHHTRDHVRFLENCARALSDEGVLRYVPFSTAILRGMLAVDRLLCSLPLLDLLGFQVTVSCRPRRAGSVRTGQPAAST